MYTPGTFRQTDPERLRGLAQARPLATLVVQGGDGLVANHVPLLWRTHDGRDVLHGHVARANPLWRLVGDGIAALAVFHGPQGYVSPGWYPTKSDDPRVVPTWNYAVVHAHGTLRAVDDPGWLRDVVTALTDRHEAARAEPWSVDDAPADFVARMLDAVVGLELVVERLEGKWKMSQNRPVADRHGVADGLRTAGEAAAADLVDGGRNGNDLP